jgi:xanthine dehydrogenase iron-sulfur cluster and FAD-binding subunit A
VRICTPGQIMAAKALLDENPQPTEDEVKDWMSGNLCRCTGYYKILESIMAGVNNKIDPNFEFRKRDYTAKMLAGPMEEWSPCSNFKTAPWKGSRL